MSGKMIVWNFSYPKKPDKFWTYSRHEKNLDKIWTNKLDKFWT